MRADEVPADMLAVQCLRCRDYLAVDPQLDEAVRRQVIREHHLWLCRVPTPNVAAYRRTQGGRLP